MSSIQSQMPVKYQDSVTRPADAAPATIDLFNIIGLIDATLPNFTLSELGMVASASQSLALSADFQVHVIDSADPDAIVRLPDAVAGITHIVINADPKNEISVHGADGEFINGASGSVEQLAGIAAIYHCPMVGHWFRIQGS
ncbi:hypothetical protein [Glaciimonas immobilis]|uniref:Uncharacterized protein n=1 Tax=Glaciimonas immobilis TaxID=728004 RepID=A0A840RWD1_9BURK|nr:hypothetical protein [Glaciimonas immobilis]KAF3997544.1 hypothetical protein HAV38_12765 [Glaciimonas immobilis]MBB5200770.1 hypothetical protein [Glaciimonas immobilis]